MKHIAQQPKQYTIIPHTILTDRRLSARALGLLILMISFPPGWRYSVAGLSVLLKDGKQSIRSGLMELENLGYLKRVREHAADGKFKGFEYEIYDSPQTVSKSTEDPSTVSPSFESPSTDSGAQVITQEGITNKHNNNTLTLNQSIIDGLRDEIKEQIEYDALISNHEPKLVDNIVDIMLDVALAGGPTIVLSGARSYPTAMVQDRFRKLTMEHVDAVLDAISKVENGVTNPHAYLLTSLFNIVATFDASVDFSFQRDWGACDKRAGGVQ